ncbi:GAF domain-containing protein [Lysobacter auxotrophicus]|uniref:GAF domain-containing protein n=1 Tax=Lysobacter auxotrophicus TaxID=2992573 RepID=A0ABN6UIV5_9GAMM|nr:GAF domain-containing protein [Lysobacter auxotrophicus]BDU16249.1 GAF domain-containing protein [Lysobacter auxotrophicus]
MARTPHRVIPAVESARQHALDRYHVVDTPSESVYDDLVRIAAHLCDAPIALLSLIDRDRQWFKARLGLAEHETPRNVAVCAHAILEPGELMEVPDLARDPRFAMFPIVIGEVRARFYASMPLTTADGQAIGTLCVVDRQPRTLEPAQRDWLESLGRVAMGLLDGHARRYQDEVRVALTTRREPEPAPVPVAKENFRIAILEVQRYAALVERDGERTVEKTLQALESRFESCLDLAAGDRVNRVSDSAEFVAVLTGDAGEARLGALREVASESAQGGLSVLVGSAVSAHGEEALGAVFLRAEADLSRRKDEAGAAAPTA